MGRRLSQLNDIDGTSLTEENYLLVDGDEYLESKKIKLKDINLNKFNTDEFYNKNQAKEKFADKKDLDVKQDKLISGTNIKTVNGKSILEEGDIHIDSGVYVGSGEMPEEYNVQIDLDGETDVLPIVDQGYSPNSENAQSGKAVAEAIKNKQEVLDSGKNIKTINGKSLLGEGDIEIKGETGTVDQNYDPESKNAQSGTAIAQAFDINDFTRTVEFDYYNKHDYQLLKSTRDKPIRGLRILGKSEQDRFTGSTRTKNLIPFPFKVEDKVVESISTDGFTFTVNNDGTIEVTGYSTEEFTYPELVISDSIILTSDVYTISGWSSDFQGKGSVNFYSPSNASGEDYISANTFEGSPCTVSVPRGQTRTFILSIMLYGSNFTKENPANFIFKLQVEQGNVTNPTYEEVEYNEDGSFKYPENHEVTNPVKDPTFFIVEDETVYEGTGITFEGITLRGIPSKTNSAGWLTRDEILFKNGTIKLIQRVDEAIDNNTTSTIVDNIEFKLANPTERDITEQFKGLLSMRTQDLRTLISMPSAGSITYVVDLANYIDTQLATMQALILED